MRKILIRSKILFSLKTKMSVMSVSIAISSTGRLEMISTILDTTLPYPSKYRKE